MNRRSETFIELFNRLEEALKIRLNKEHYTPYSAMVQEAALKDVFIREHKTLLEKLGDLRNVLVHKEGSQIIAVPSEEAVKKLKELIDKYTQPKIVYELCSRQVTVIGGDRSMAEALKIMQKYQFTKLPIYKEKKFIGLLSGNIIASWLASGVDQEGEITAHFKEITIEDVLTKVGKKDQVNFIERNMSVYAFLHLSQEQPSKSGVYIITQHGRISEKPIGILTIYDYPSLLKELIIS